MKLTVELEPGETPAEADRILLKALLNKEQLKDEAKERYDDPALDEFHEMMTAKHLTLLNRIQNQVTTQIEFLMKWKS